MNGFNIQQIVTSCFLCTIACKSTSLLETSEFFSDQLICKNEVTFETDKNTEWKEFK